MTVIMVVDRYCLEACDAHTLTKKVVLNFLPDLVLPGDRPPFARLHPLKSGPKVSFTAELSGLG